MEDFVRVNVRGTRNVLDAAGPRRTVVLASVAGWGYEFARELREDSPPRPCGLPYVDTKGATETLALRRGATVIRPGDVYGPGSTPVGDPAARDDARRPLLPPQPGRRGDDAGVHRRPRRRDRAGARASRARPGAPTRCGTARPSPRASTSSGSAAGRCGRCPRRSCAPPAPSARDGPGGRDVRHTTGGVPERPRARGARLAAAHDARRGHGAHARMGARGRPA